MADKFIRDDCLNEEGQQNYAHDLRQREKAKMANVVREFVIVVAGKGLHHDADEHRHCEQKYLDQDDCRQFREPVSGIG